MCLNKSPMSCSHIYGSSSLQQVNFSKHLGVTMASNLSWNIHINNVCSTAFRKLCLLQHKFRTAPTAASCSLGLTPQSPQILLATTTPSPHTLPTQERCPLFQHHPGRAAYPPINTDGCPDTCPSLKHEAPTLPTIEDNI